MINNEVLMITNVATGIITTLLGALCTALVFYLIKTIRLSAIKRKKEIEVHDQVHQMLIKGVRSIQRKDFAAAYKQILKDGFVTMYEK